MENLLKKKKGTYKVKPICVRKSNTDESTVQPFPFTLYFHQFKNLPTVFTFSSPGCTSTPYWFALVSSQWRQKATKSSWHCIDPQNLSPSHLSCALFINLHIEFHSFALLKVHIDCLFVAWLFIFFAFFVVGSSHLKLS